MNDGAFDMSFDDWLQHLLTGSAAGYVRTWWKSWDPTLQSKAARPADLRRIGGTSVAYCTRLFTQSGSLMRQWADDAVADGLERLLRSEEYSWDIQPVNEASILPWQARSSCIIAIETLFADVFDCRLRTLSAEQVTNAQDALASVCWWWWEWWFSAVGYVASREVELVTLAVMYRILQLGSAASQLSVLRKLGVFNRRYGSIVSLIVEEFLDCHPETSHLVREMASDARCSQV